MVWGQFLSLCALIFYPPLPLMIIFIHKTLPFWRALGTKSYYFFILGFFMLFYLLGSLVFSFKEEILAWRLYETHWAYLGFIPLLGGIILGIMSVRTLSLKVLMGLPEINFTLPSIPSHQGRGSSGLIVHGIYRYIRHPRYLEFVLEVLGIAILSGLVWNFILLIYFVPAAFAMAYVEEQELLKRFGEEYRAYKAKTGWFIPKI